MLSAEQLESWSRDGMLILPSFYESEELEIVDRAMRAVWERRDPRVVVDDTITGRRCLLPALTEQERGHRFKTNDLYLTEESVRGLAMGPRMAPILETLLGQTPVLCNSLNFDQGSSQGAHIDSLYMTPITPGHLCAIWIALEDVVPEAGPLFFYRGSHRLPARRFSDGTFHSIEAEMPAWHAETDRLLAERGLQQELFLAKRGDVFIWSADLVHGGSPITDANRTRKSVVFHYFSKADCDTLGWKLVPMNNGYWIDRPRQPVPEDVAPDAPSVSEQDVQSMLRRIARLEADLERLRRDPFRVRLMGARARKWFRRKLGRTIA